MLVWPYGCPLPDPLPRQATELLLHHLCKGMTPPVLDCVPYIPTAYLTGEDIQICLLGLCLLMTYVPWDPSLTVSTPCCSTREQKGCVCQWGGRSYASTTVWVHIGCTPRLIWDDNALS